MNFLVQISKKLKIKKISMEITQKEMKTKFASFIRLEGEVNVGKLNFYLDLIQILISLIFRLPKNYPSCKN
ncbi:hypothetical protein BpHYR1_019859 [Brachionus plicatilis]|uniref:Uncharacterized protein n=1 Tax=Brachionus plicatilis TaxID=10195 RepID=A0A3M7R3J7_BRAPC|nr:hypothetical protein BpHYR1_019859 [Brachionus plicatilis]